MKQFMMLAIAVALLSMVFIGCESANTDPITVGTWFRYTAPGDDGIEGQASITQIRVAMTADSLVNNWSDCLIIDEHQPWPTQTYDSVLVEIIINTGVDYYFAAKVADEVPNWSLLSNIIARNWADDMSPSPIGDFSFGG